MAVLVKTDADAAKSDPLYREAPCNIEAEQSLLGALLVNNDALAHIGDGLRAEHFYEPLHGRIFDAIQKFNNKGLIANPVTLKHYFDQDTSLADIGGGAYLAKLAAGAINVINIADYGQMIYDLALKRQLIGIGEEMVNTAYSDSFTPVLYFQISKTKFVDFYRHTLVCHWWCIRTFYKRHSFQHLCRSRLHRFVWCSGTEWYCLDC